MAKLIDGKYISAQIKDEVKDKVKAMKEQGTDICLAVIQVGEDPASSVYVRNKKGHVNMSESNLFLMNCLKQQRKKSFWH